MYLSHDSLDQDYEVTARELNIMVKLAREFEGVYGRSHDWRRIWRVHDHFGRSKVVPEFQATVAREYEKLTRLSPQIVVSAAAAGASEVAI